jgi:succinyl-diaminopimelate desuccinylase
MPTAEDLLNLTARLVDIPSVSLEEHALADWLEAELRAIGSLAVHRVGSNVVARTELGRARRLVLAGHTDTVPPAGNEVARQEGDTLWGVGSADMKSGLAVMLALARTLRDPPLDVTWIFYAGEEVAAVHNGLGHLFRDRPELLVGDVALLGEPTGAAIEAGCQGTMRLQVTLRGTRAHTARPWMGRNAVHRLGGLLRLVESFDERQPILDGCQYREALQAVLVSGGVAANVVPDEAVVTLNHRFAPDRTPAEAESMVRALLAPVLDTEDGFEVVDFAPAAAPGLDHALLRTLIERNGLEVRAKLGWTDVARFTSHGIPAANFGPGDPLLAHRSDERVTGQQLIETFRSLDDLVRHPPKRPDGD